ncbi:S-adenosylmethionine decarboxylase proenzyme 2-like isoform X2 [Rhincodon typus]|uniref:S-adenosylmethionine decarboxylase proenzyme 2-like isoform X2 n=1 Tax=Rhincodon typus TaxID=259920 RepID=UPI00202DD645|nr:S-adenosylmethionine decarboxylase proenzyme 2-like isoform X2 [Rhincodon typus]
MSRKDTMQNERIIYHATQVTGVWTLGQSLWAESYKILSDIFFSRKKFRKPTSQDYAQRSFEEEVKFLNILFPNGVVHCMGRVHSDCWY